MKAFGIVKSVLSKKVVNHAYSILSLNKEYIKNVDKDKILK